MHFTIPLGGMKSSRGGACVSYPGRVYMNHDEVPPLGINIA